MLMYATLLPHQKKGAQLTPEKVLPFTWDKDQSKTEQTTPEDIEAVKAFWKEKDKNKS